MVSGHSYAITELVLFIFVYLEYYSYLCGVKRKIILGRLKFKKNEKEN